MKNLLLSGVKHCGKSTIGRLLQENFSYNFYDLDDLIIENSPENYSHVRELYREHGKEQFQFREADSARKFYKDFKENNKLFVLALGGGTLENGDIIERLKEIALLVFIDMPPQLLFKRIQAGGLPPFLETDDPYKSFLNLYHKRRETGISNADIVIDGKDKESKDISRELGNLIKSLYGKDKDLTPER